jgi:hypothetical protein
VGSDDHVPNAVASQAFEQFFEVLRRFAHVAPATLFASTRECSLSHPVSIAPRIRDLPPPLLRRTSTV